MKPWMTPRCLIIAFLLVGAPAAALGHLLASWLPTSFALTRLQRQTAEEAGRVEQESQQCAQIREEIARLRALADESERSATPLWLPGRQSHTVFDALGRVFDRQRVSIRQLKLDEPGLYAVVPPDCVLACEDVTIECAGTYAALTDGLDSLEALDLPLRFRHATWLCEGDRLRFVARVQVPFLPGDALRQTLAGDVEFEESDEF